MPDDKPQRDLAGRFLPGNTLAIDASRATQWKPVSPVAATVNRGYDGNSKIHSSKPWRPRAVPKKPRACYGNRRANMKLGPSRYY